MLLVQTELEQIELARQAWVSGHGYGYGWAGLVRCLGVYTRCRAMGCDATGRDDPHLKSLSACLHLAPFAPGT